MTNLVSRCRARDPIVLASTASKNPGNTKSESQNVPLSETKTSQETEKNFKKFLEPMSKPKVIYTANSRKVAQAEEREVQFGACHAVLSTIHGKNRAVKKHPSQSRSRHLSRFQAGHVKAAQRTKVLSLLEVFFAERHKKYPRPMRLQHHPIDETS